ncbi:MAG: hypothetical protein VYE22_16485 [Myxococcota bacterium]|nr:hypothetical protein [Myxococcota bacterium]
MTRIAILDETLPAQVAENPGAFEGIEVVWAGTDVHDLLGRAPEVAPHVLVCSLSLLEPHPTEMLQRLERLESLELVILLYEFARREELSSYEGGRRRVVKAPVSPERLRSQMMSVVVKQLFGGASASRATLAAAASAAPPAAPRGTNPPRRFTPAQLGRLMEIQSAVDCECPNHLSQLVSSLAAFERYSAQCEDRGDADAEVHGMLHRETGRARALMEEALARLVAHEGIEL